jgi:phosphoribosylaminoimidazole-succinocarboxamide synthase
MRDALLTTSLRLPNRRSGKVRDLYDVTLPDGEPGVLIVATDRISAFDVVMANGIPGKGIVLTQLSKFWFDRVGGRVPHHLVSTDVAQVPGLSAGEREVLAGRIMLCRRTEVIPIECVARGYLAGSGYKDYQRTGEVCGQRLPQGLRNGDVLPEAIFTPATKVASGHDENIAFDDGAALLGVDLMQWLAETTLALYREAREYALSRGIILADTKFEFGRVRTSSRPLLIDEIFTPDSSRFWPADAWRPGGEQPSYDKQFVRDYLEKLVAAGDWDKSPPGPALPRDVVASTLERYLEAYRLITGRTLDLPA